MDDHESPLLSKESSSSSSSMVASSLKWILNVIMYVIFVAWVVFIVMYPGKLGDEILTNWRAVSSKTLYGTTGTMFLIFSGPILVISVLASLYLIISGEDKVFTKFTVANQRGRDPQPRPTPPPHLLSRRAPRLMLKLQCRNFSFSFTVSQDVSPLSQLLSVTSGGL